MTAFLTWFLLFPSLAAAAEKTLSRSQMKKFVSMAVKYWALKHQPKGEEKRDKILGELKAFEGFCWKGLRKAFRPPTAKPIIRPQKKKSGATLLYPPAGLEGCQYILDLPRGYTPARAWPLIFLLHGGGMNEGHGSQIHGLLGPSYKKRGCILVAPTCPPNTKWDFPIVENFILSILGELALMYSIDFDRIYVAGHSFGGCGAWSFGARFPDLFAGFGPAAGTPPNVMDFDLFHNTAFYVAHGKTDSRVVPKGDFEARDKVEALDPKPRAYIFDFFVAGDAIGHGFPRVSIEAMADFLTKHKREMFVKKYHAFWLGVDEHPGYLGKAVGEWTGNNRIRIRREGVSSVSVYVSDDFLDLSKPVIVEVDGQKIEKTVKRSAEFLLKHVEETKDRGRIFANRIAVGP
jgi:pimeloyl-ACP methyl ester carboxylesterase